MGSLFSGVGVCGEFGSPTQIRHTRQGGGGHLIAFPKQKGAITLTVRLLTTSVPLEGHEAMTPLTRRGFLTTSGLGTGLGLIAAAGFSRDAAAQSGVSPITSNFNGTPIAAGDFIWFNSALKVQGLGVDPVTVGFTSTIQFAVDGVTYMVAVPSAILNFLPGAVQATTVFCNGQWVTTVPLTHVSGNAFLAGVALQAPAPKGFPGGIHDVTWSAMFFSVTPGLKVQWQWAAAIYHKSNFSADYNALGVKPVDDNDASAYQNSDHAGTPENFKPFVIGGARGGGGSNFTGSYSGTGSSFPTPANMAAACGGS
jgi:hypothetical protein